MAAAPTPVRFRKRGEPAATLSFEEALESPCATCATSPCCTTLSLRTFQVRTLVDLDYARYLLNFDGIELGVAHSGTWSVFYRRPCRFLGPDRSCMVHATPAQPSICAHYNPYSCWYRRSFLAEAETDDYLRLDRRRLELFLRHTEFDQARNVAAFPAWEALDAAFADLAIEPGPPSQASPGDEVLGLPPVRVTLTAGTPCGGCDAYCCTSLVFPLAVPATLVDLDYLRYALGFPGVEAVVTDHAWSLAVRTRCRHLDGTGCGVYGTAERPLVCQYYDEWKCTYRVTFSAARRPDRLRVTYADFPELLEHIDLDADGRVVRIAPTADMGRLGG